MKVVALDFIEKNVIRDAPYSEVAHNLYSGRDFC